MFIEMTELTYNKSLDDQFHCLTNHSPLNPQMRPILFLLLYILLGTSWTEAQTNRTTIGGQTVTDYQGSYSNYVVPSYGYVRRYYVDGIWQYSVNGSLLDYGYFGSLKTINSNVIFDLGKIGQLGRAETEQKFAAIWQAFRESHVLNSEGRYVASTTADTPANKLSLFEFAHHVSEARPTISINSIEKCPKCDGKRVRPGITPTGAVGDVMCEACNAHGSIAKQENFALIYSGQLPPRPTLDDLIKEGLVGAKKVVTPITQKPMKVRQTTPEPPVIVKEYSLEERYRITKSKAEAGDTQAQYDLGLIYAQEFERTVPLDYYEAFSWFQKASAKNHRLAQYQVGKYFEIGRGVESRNLQEALKWRRSSALLGCKMSQRWMAQLYINTFQGSDTFSDFIKKDVSNLVEAYAWACLGAERSLAQRVTAGTPTAEEIAAGHPLILRDYEFERGACNAAARDRDGIAARPEFTKRVFEDAKLRATSLQAEAEEYQKANKPK